MTQDVCGIHFAAGSISAVTLRPGREGMRLLSGQVREGRDLNAQELGAALRGVMRDVPYRGQDVTLSLPKSQVSLHRVTLPTDDENELGPMVRFEAERHIPFNAERHGVGYQRMRNLGIEGSEVLLAAADQPVIERALNAAAEARLQPRAMSVSSTCLYNALLLERPDLARERSVVLCAIGVTSLEFVFCTQGRILYARSIDHGLQDLIRNWTADGAPGLIEINAARIATAAKMINMMDIDRVYEGEGDREGKGDDGRPGDPIREWVNTIVQELRLSLDYARREHDFPNVDSIVLTGEGVMLRNLDQYLGTNLGVEVTVLNPAAATGGSFARNFAFGGAELTCAIGAAVQGVLDGAYKIDLIPPQYHQRAERRVLVRGVSVTAGLALVALILGAAACVRQNDVQQRQALDYARANEMLEPVVGALQEEEQKLQILQGFLEDPGSAAAVLEALGEYPALGERVGLTRIAYEKGAEVLLEGHAREIDDVTDFSEYLLRTGLFETVDVQEQRLTTALRNRPQVYDFRMRAYLPTEVSPAGLGGGEDGGAS